MNEITSTTDPFDPESVDPDEHAQAEELPTLDDDREDLVEDSPFDSLTEEEAAEGQRLGEQIDPEDDDDGTEDES